MPAPPISNADFQKYLEGKKGNIPGVDADPMYLDDPPKTFFSCLVGSGYG